jgi:hypothetical protein
MQIVTGPGNIFLRIELTMNFIFTYKRGNRERNDTHTEMKRMLLTRPAARRAPELTGSVAQQSARHVLRARPAPLFICSAVVHSHCSMPPIGGGVQTVTRGLRDG